jgi:histone H3/H4
MIAGTKRREDSSGKKIAHMEGNDFPLATFRRIMKRLGQGKEQR